MTRSATSLLALPLLLAVLPVQSADPVFSGPQPGESITPFTVLEIGGPEKGRERDPVTQAAGVPMAIVFVHAIERSLVPLLRAVDLFGADHREQLRTEIVFLAADRLEGERRVGAANSSLKLQARVGLSLDGAEGPGNYGLNRDCMMTIVTAKENRVLTNFALVQPGIADAPAVITALARAAGTPPPEDPGRYTQPPRDRAMAMAPASRDQGIPGAVPDDPQLNRLIRQFIRPTNDVATVDQILASIEKHVAGDPELTKQAIDAWTRILHFGDRYGTAHAREVARASLERLQKP